MFHLGALMQAKVEKEDIRKMQSQGTNYANRNYLGGKTDE